MKKSFAFLMAAVAVAIAAVIIFMPSPAASSLKPVASAAPAAMPDSILKIFQKSCMDCHATGGNPMAKSHVDFSIWNSYSTEKQAEKAMSVCKILTKDAMPPKGWRKNNPDGVPTDRDKKAICAWASSMNP